MTMKKPFLRLPLENGLELDFFDLGNRYFGDYHRVRILVRCEIPLCESMFSEQDQPRKSLERARRWLGDQVVFEKKLDRMGVAGGDVATVRQQMVDNFMATAGYYLCHPKFVRQLVDTQLRARQRRPIAVPGR